MASPNMLKQRKREAKLRVGYERVEMPAATRPIRRTPALRKPSRKRVLRRLRFTFDPPLTHKGQVVGQDDDGNPVYALTPQQTAMREQRTAMKAQGRPPTVRSRRLAQKITRRSRRG